MNTKGTPDLTDEERLLADVQQNHIDHNKTHDDEAIENVLDEDLEKLHIPFRTKTMNESPRSLTFPYVERETSYSKPSRPMTSVKPYSPDNHGTSKRTSWKATTASCDGIRLTPKFSKSYYLIRSDPVYSTSPITR